MDRIQQRCLIGSTVLHGGLLVVVLALSGWAAKKAIQPEVPFLEIIPTDLRLTMGDQIGGGTPNPRPLAAREGTPPPQKIETPAPPVSPPVQQVEPKPVEVPKPVTPKPVETRQPDPPKPVETKTERKIEVAKDTRPVAKAQDVDPTKKAEKPAASSPPKTPPKIQVSSQVRTRSQADRQSAEKEAREAREAAAAEARARDQRLAAAQKLASRVSGAASGVSRNVGGATQIEMPGPGGAAYAPYLSWLQTFLYEQWRRPSTSPRQQEWVGMEIVIARNGTVLSFRVTRSSGIRSLDASAEEVFRRNRKLRPLPDEFTEPRLVVPVKFVLEASETL